MARSTLATRYPEITDAHLRLQQPIIPVMRDSACGLEGHYDRLPALAADLVNKTLLSQSPRPHPASQQGGNLHDTNRFPDRRRPGPRRPRHMSRVSVVCRPLSNRSGLQLLHELTPTMYGDRVWVMAGGLVSYDASTID